MFPRLEAIKNDDAALWELDSEAKVLVPVVIVVTIGLFAVLGGWAFSASSTSNRPATVALVCGILGVVGVLAFFLSAPIILGGLAITLGVEGGCVQEGKGKGTRAVAGIVLGALALAIGAAAWLFA